MHAFSEGLPIHNTGENLLWAIIVNKIPIAVVLTTFLIHSNYSKKMIVLFLITFSLMSPLGVLLGDEISFFETYSTEITAIIIGIFLLLLSSSYIFDTNSFRYLNALNPFLTTLDPLTDSVAEHATTSIQLSFLFHSILLIFSALGAWFLLSKKITKQVRKKKSHQNSLKNYHILISSA